ncbi:MAG: hypothetical protein JNL67_12225 [Planctomycetaceae bacterium]|nr:hypothetical protein [Planctomycetaceae bacterium]
MQANEEQIMWLGLNAILEHVHIENASDSGLNETVLSLVPNAQRSMFGVSLVRVGEKRPWGHSFEFVRERLEADGNAHVEGDGSFVLCGQASCSEQNKLTLWLGQLPQIAQILPTNQWRDPAVTSESRMVWRIEGNLCDGAAGLDSISLNGWAPWSEWQKLLALIGPTNGLTPFTIQLHHFGVYVTLASDNSVNRSSA